jgi:hypothetical protein
MVVFDNPDKIKDDLTMAGYLIGNELEVIVENWASEQAIMTELWGESYSDKAIQELIKQETLPILHKRLEKIFYGE